MRVNLTYSVALDEVESRVADLIRESSKKTDTIATTLQELANFVVGGEGNLIRAQLDKIRMELAALDMRLLDCDSILGAYLQTVEHIKQGQINSLGPVPHGEEGVENDEEG